MQNVNFLAILPPLLHSNIIHHFFPRLLLLGFCFAQKTKQRNSQIFSNITLLQLKRKEKQFAFSEKKSFIKNEQRTISQIPKNPKSSCNHHVIIIETNIIFEIHPKQKTKNLLIFFRQNKCCSLFFCLFVFLSLFKNSQKKNKNSVKFFLLKIFSGIQKLLLFWCFVLFFLWSNHIFWSYPLIKLFSSQQT